MTISGLPMKASVSALPSLRAGKLRLKEVTIVFFSPGFSSSRFHWPMHGPQALASTVAADLLQVGHLPVAADRGVDLLRARA